MKRLVELHSKSQYPSFYLSDQTCNYSVKLTPLVNANSLYIVISHKKELLAKRKRDEHSYCRCSSFRRCEEGLV